MSLASMLNDRCDVHRNQAVGTNGRRSFQLVASSVACKFIPLDREPTIAMNLTVGYAFTVYMAADAGTVAGDKLIKAGVSYLVHAVSHYDFNSTTRHLELIVETEKANV